MMDGEFGIKFLSGELLKYNGDLNFADRPLYRTALWEGVVSQHEQVVKYLLEKGVNVDCRDSGGA